MLLISDQQELRPIMGNAASAGLGDETSHDERDISSVGDTSSGPGPNEIELASEALDRNSNSLKTENPNIPNSPSSYKQPV